jgi:hypothetical protein
MLLEVMYDQQCGKQEPAPAVADSAGCTAPGRDVLVNARSRSHHRALKTAPDLFGMCRHCPGGISSDV